MTVVTREQLLILVNTASRRQLSPVESAALRGGVTTALGGIDQLQRERDQLRSQNADYEQVIRHQRAEILNADQARRTAGGLAKQVARLREQLAELSPQPDHIRYAGQLLVDGPSDPH